MKEGRKPQYQEKIPDDELDKMFDSFVFTKAHQRTSQWQRQHTKRR